MDGLQLNPNLRRHVARQHVSNHEFVARTSCCNASPRMVVYSTRRNTELYNRGFEREGAHEWTAAAFVVILCAENHVHVRALQAGLLCRHRIA